MALPHHTPMTIEEYFALDERDSDIRYEYVDGHIRRIEVFRRREAQDKGWFYSAFLNSGDEVALTTLNIRFPIESIYRGVDIALMPGLEED